MDYLNSPRWKKLNNIYILYKVNFENDPNSSSMVASGEGMEVGTFKSLEKLQEKSVELFKQKAVEIK